MSVWDKIASWGGIPQVGQSADNGVTMNRRPSDPMSVPDAGQRSLASRLLQQLTGQQGQPRAHMTLGGGGLDMSHADPLPIPQLQQIDLPQYPSDPGVVARPSGPPPPLEALQPQPNPMLGHLAYLQALARQRTPLPFPSMGQPRPLPNGDGSQ